jgi:hypothetical protein
VNPRAAFERAPGKGERAEMERERKDELWGECVPKSIGRCWILRWRVQDETFERMFDDYGWAQRALGRVVDGPLCEFATLTEFYNGEARR